ncbi:2-oxoglutarate dehydrogenase E1 subunit family protein, partial [Amycolatopsis rubida]
MASSSPASQFGANEWLVEEMYERFLADPQSVDAAWHDFFADYKPTPGGNGTQEGNGEAKAAASAPAAKPAAKAPAAPAAKAAAAPAAKA